MKNDDDDYNNNNNKDTSIGILDSRFNQTLRNVQGLLKGRSIPGKILLSQRVDPVDNSNLYSPTHKRSSLHSDTTGTSDHTSETVEDEGLGRSKSISIPNENKLKTSTSHVENPPEEVRKSSMGARATDSARVMKFTKVLSGTMVILDKLRELAWSGVPDYMRPTVWRLLLIIYLDQMDKVNDHLQHDKAKVITNMLEEIDRQFLLMATDIDNKLEAFSEYIIKAKKDIFQVLDIHQYPSSSKNTSQEEASSSNFLGKEKDFSKKLRFVNSTFKDKLINSPIKEPTDKFFEIYQNMVKFMYQGNPRNLENYIIEYKGIYPRIMIILDDWEDVILLTDLLRFGFIDTIYIDPSNDLSKLKYFPEPIVLGIRNYIKGVNPQRTIFVKVYTASPDKEGDTVYFVKIGALNGEEIQAQEYSTKEQEPIIDEDWITKRRALGFHVLLMMMKKVYDQGRFWSYSMTEKAIVICNKDKDQQPGILRTLQLFIQKIERNHFQGQLKTHQQFCKIVKANGEHKCHHCKSQE